MMKVGFTEKKIMELAEADIIGWCNLYEKLGLLELDWGDIKPDVKYVFMSQKNQKRLMKVWKNQLPKTKDKKLRNYRMPYRERCLSWDDVCFHPTYADDLGEHMLLIDTDAGHLKKFDIKLEQEKD